MYLLDHLLAIGIVLGATIHGTTGILVGDTIAGIHGTDLGAGTVGIIVQILAGAITFTMEMYFMAITGMAITGITMAGITITGITMAGITMAGTIGITDTKPAIKLMAVEKADRLHLL